jgi:hypothetical protein
MTPTVGRVVHFQTLDHRTVPAVVARVVTDEELDLFVMDPKEGACFRNAQRSADPSPLRWSWTPRDLQRERGGVPLPQDEIAKLAPVPAEVPAVPLAEEAPQIPVDKNGNPSPDGYEVKA